MSDVPTRATCDLCKKDMQVNYERTNDKGEVIQRTFFCACQRFIVWKNYHKVQEPEAHEPPTAR